MPVRVPNSGEVYRAGERLPTRDPLIAKLAHLMDGAIPIGRWSIGLDPILGLIPGIGDLIGVAISMLIVMRAMQAGIPRVAIARMMTNVAIDSLIGAIPVVGDVFDFAYKANQKNLRIYEQSLHVGRDAPTGHWGFFIAVFAIVAAVITGLVYFFILLARAI